MIYAFTKLSDQNTIASFDPYLDVEKGMYKHFNDLRQMNPQLKTLVAIGGWGEGSDKYSAMVNNAGHRKTFIDSVVKFIGQHGFNGLDLDWEYPGQSARGDGDRQPGNEADKQAFVDLLRELNVAFKPHGYLLTAAVAAGRSTIDRGYNVPEMNKYLDFINLMTYDLHGSWEQKTGHHAALHSGPGDNEQDKMLTVESAVDYWLKLGAEPKKLVVGIPFYGRTFKLQSALNSGINSPASGGAGAGPYTKTSGFLGYNEICENQSKWSVHWDDQRKATYAVMGTDWVGYDNEQSIMAKVDFIKSKGLGGAMVWAIETDDFNGLCGKGKFPLLNAINNGLK
ncbi:unnamed protein product [Medioppia subpectinata]|uniref:chitinase n=1 Tax=Medioppia subpectinata TaxID=1979941 RepID=A0A7R9Q455_9ACAR|nr:unnamed protein product [Medioppia subpectinata]CAG2112038.1 unnamed protein product [Medioppia subpectinata]